MFGLWTGFAIGLTACAPPTISRHEVDMPTIAVPSQWQGSDSLSIVDATRWWERFDDALLISLIGDALRSNTTVLGAEASVRQARAARELALAGLWPTLGIAATAQRTQRGGGSTDLFSTGLDAAWELDVFGSKHDALNVARANAAASVASLGSVQVTIAGEVALAYIGLRSAQARLAIANSSLIGQSEISQLARWRLQAGLVSTLDLEQSTAVVEQTRAIVPALQLVVSQSIHALEVLSGRPPQSLRGILNVEVPVPTTHEELAIGIPADALRQRADVRAAEWLLIGASASVSQAKASRLPSLKFGGSLAWNASALAGLGSGVSAISMILASLSLPIIDGGAGRANTDEKLARLEKAKSDYKASVLTALKEVEDALVALQADRSRLQSLSLAMEAANRAAQVALQRYQSGIVDFQVVLDTQRTYLMALDSQALAIASVSSDHVRLFKAMGGGWTRSQEAAL